MCACVCLDLHATMTAARKYSTVSEVPKKNIDSTPVSRTETAVA